MDPQVDAYVDRSTLWPAEIAAIRPLLTNQGLQEALKWGKPCYGIDGKNILILQEMKHFLAMMFFKGALLSDPEQVLEEQGPNSRAARRMCFTSVAEVNEHAATIKAYVAEAIQIEADGIELAPAPPETLAPELQDRLNSDRAFRLAFESLTPGRRREYNLHFSDAKTAATRLSRIDKCAPKILAGKGFRDR